MALDGAGGLTSDKTWNLGSVALAREGGGWEEPRARETSLSQQARAAAGEPERHHVEEGLGSQSWEAGSDTWTASRSKCNTETVLGCSTPASGSFLRSGQLPRGSAGQGPAPHQVTAAGRDGRKGSPWPRWGTPAVSIRWRRFCSGGATVCREPGSLRRISRPRGRLPLVTGALGLLRLPGRSSALSSFVSVVTHLAHDRVSKVDAIFTIVCTSVLQQTHTSNQALTALGRDGFHVMWPCTLGQSPPPQPCLCQAGEKEEMLPLPL